MKLCCTFEILYLILDITEYNTGYCRILVLNLLPRNEVNKSIKLFIIISFNDGKHRKSVALFFIRQFRNRKLFLTELKTD